jgi:hypothetical protein
VHGGGELPENRHGETQPRDGLSYLAHGEG